MLLNKEKSGLVLVDVQTKLTPLVLNSQSLIGRCQWLIRLAQELGVNVVVSEHYSRGLGNTEASLKELAANEKCIDKVHFSCYREPSFQEYWKTLHKQQVILAGIETHVCVLQTAIDMQTAGFDVFVVVDAVSSRHEMDHKYGLKRMKQAGVQLVTTEMVFFEWVVKAGTPEFKALSLSYLR